MFAELFVNTNTFLTEYKILLLAQKLAVAIPKQRIFNHVQLIFGDMDRELLTVKDVFEWEVCA